MIIKTKDEFSNYISIMIIWITTWFLRIPRRNQKHSHSHHWTTSQLCSSRTGSPWRGTSCSCCSSSSCQEQFSSSTVWWLVKNQEIFLWRLLTWRATVKNRSSWQIVKLTSWDVTFRENTILLFYKSQATYISEF